MAAENWKLKYTETRSLQKAGESTESKRDKEWEVGAFVVRSLRGGMTAHSRDACESWEQSKHKDERNMAAEKQRLELRSITTEFISLQNLGLN